MFNIAYFIVQTLQIKIFLPYLCRAAHLGCPIMTGMVAGPTYLKSLSQLSYVGAGFMLARIQTRSVSRAGINPPPADKPRPYKLHLLLEEYNGAENF
jgi:hypothetical protein